MRNLFEIRIHRRIILIACIITQAIFLGLLGLENIGIILPFLRGIIGFLTLFLLPGILLSEVMDIKADSLTEKLCYIIGLSLIISVLLGLLANYLYPLISLSKPLETLPFSLTLSSCIIFLCLYLLVKKRALGSNIVKFSLCPEHFLLSLLPFLSIIGAVSTYYYNNNALLFFLLIIVGSTPLLVISNRIRAYSFTILTISLALFYHWQLSNPFLSGWDIYFEAYHANLVNMNGLLNLSSGFSKDMNSMLMSTLLAPLCAKVLKLDLTLCFKAVYPLLFSMIPLALYEIVRKQTDDKIAFLSSFFLISNIIFYENKDMNALFFIALLTLLIVNRSLNRLKKACLSLIFTWGLVTSHYGITYFLIISSFAILALSLLIERKLKLMSSSPEKNVLCTFNFCVFSTTLTISWYMFTGEGVGFTKIVHFGFHAMQSITELFSPVTRGGIYFIKTSMPSLDYEILRLLFFISYFFMGIGYLSVLYTILKKRGKVFQFKNEFFFYSGVSLGWILADIIFSKSFAILGSLRLHYLTLLFTSPFCIIGGSRILTTLRKHIRASHTYDKVFIDLAIFLMIFLLFNSRLVMEVHREVSPQTSDYGFSVSLSQPRIKSSNFSLDEAISFYCSIPSEKDVLGAEWLGKHKDLLSFWSDRYSMKTLSFYGMVPYTSINELKSDSEIPRGYVYLMEINYVFKLIIEKSSDGEIKHYDSSTLIASLEETKNKIYSNGGSVIYG